MAQVLKEEIFERIFKAGIEVFYEKDFRTAKMQDIAKKAGIPVSLIYNYHKNKEELFEKIAASISVDFDRIAEEEEELPAGSPSEKYKSTTENYLLDLLDNHKIFVILMDKSQGTKYEDSKDKMIDSIEKHIRRQLSKKSKTKYDDMLCHILASNFAESILEIARHYKDRKFAARMLEQVTQCYFEGVNSLF